ncbi:NAD(P)-binding protein [Sarocladium implicatum]|nr:NAD(P)-binding protein [Sarocladium implicatum]
MATRALVVGGTSGIGYAMACRIAASSPAASVIISGRTKPKDLPHKNMEFRPIEATSMREIKSFTDRLKQLHPESSNTIQSQSKTMEDKSKFDLLVMTQGIMSMAGRTETTEGIDRKMALHYYGKQLLIRELMPALKDDAKVIIVYDSKTGNPGQLIWDDLDLKTHFGLGTAANHCMVMNDIMVQHYAAQQSRAQNDNKHAADTRRLFVHAWPGGVGTTGLMRELPWLLGCAIKIVAPVVPLLTVTADTCAEYLLNGVDRVVKESEEKNQDSLFRYIDNKGRDIQDKPVFTEEERERVADHTWKLIDLALSR